MINSISVGARLADPDQSLLQIQINLTEKGEESWEDVVRVVFEYCSLLLKLSRNAKGGDSDDLNTLERVWDEICTLRKLQFHQSPPTQAYSLAPILANSVRKNGTQKCLSLGSLLDETKGTLPVDNLLNFMENINPDNCIVERCSKTAWNDLKIGEMNQGRDGKDTIFGIQTEKWYGVDYHLAPIDLNTVDSWRGIKTANQVSSITESYDLHLPDANKHIPRDLSMCEDLPDSAKRGAQISKVMNPPNLLVETGRKYSCVCSNDSARTAGHSTFPTNTQGMK